MKQQHLFSLLFTLFLAVETVTILFVPFWWFLPFSLFISVVAWGSLTISSQLFVPTICHHSGRGIILSFDDGPDKNQTVRVLDTLKKHSAQALFFVVGKQVKKHPDILRRIVDEGHTVGIHTFSHSPFFGFFSTKKMQSEILETADIIEKTSGVKPTLFRPPSGVTNPPLAKALRMLNLTTIGWSVRSFDTLFSDRDKLLKRLIRHTKEGDIVLLHDRLAITADVLDEYLQSLHDSGFLVDSIAEYRTVRQDKI